LKEVTICIIATIVFGIFFTKNILQLIVNRRSHNNYVKEILLIIYSIIILLCIWFYIFIGFKRYIPDIIISAVYISIGLSIFAIIIWLVIGLLSKTAKIKFKTVYFWCLILLTMYYFIWQGHGLFYSAGRGSVLFYENIELFENFIDYVKSDDFKGPTGGDGYYELKSSRLWFNSSNTREEIENENLINLFMQIRATCYVNNIFIIYYNKDVSFYVKDDHGFQYTDDETMKKIFEHTMSFRELDKGWYIESHNPALMSRDRGYINNSSKIKSR
jgi:hypothetical protein